MNVCIGVLPKHHFPWCGRLSLNSLIQASRSACNRSVSTILRQPVLEFKLGFLRVEMAG